MDTKRITVERCESCQRHHRLRITYDPASLPTIELPSDVVVLPVEYVCPNTGRKTTVELDFDAPVELVNTVAE